MVDKFDPTDPRNDAAVRLALAEGLAKRNPSPTPTQASAAYAAAKQLIATAKRENAIELSFNTKETHALTHLPPEIADLSRLKSLTLDDTQISDLAPVAGLTGLTGLSFNNTQISDLTPVAGLTGLTYLSLNKTQISDLAPVAGLTGLTDLSLSNTQISNLAPVAVLTGLTDLRLDDTQISDLRALRGLTKLATAPSFFGLRFGNCAAAQADPQVAKIAAIEDNNARAQALFDLLDAGWVPVGDGGDAPKTLPFVFLSYASASRSKIAAYHQFFQTQSLPLWWDQDIPAGGAWRGSIADQLANAHAVLTFWDANSVQSNAVIEEAATAQRAGKLLHARLDDAPLPYGFGETQYVDLREWDGTPAHPAMRKLLQAMRDKLAPPDATTLTARISQANPIAMAARNGKLTPKDTPANAPPEVDNPDALDDRLRGLKDSVDFARERLANDHRHQFSPDVVDAMTGIHRVLTAEKLSWDGIHNARLSLAENLEPYADLQQTGLMGDLRRIVPRLAELRPLLQPRQVPFDAPGAKPPEPEPSVRATQSAEVEKIGTRLDAVLASDEAKAVLDAAALAQAQDAIALIKSAKLAMPDAKLSRLRRGLKRIAYFTGAVGVAVGGTVGGGVIVNLLTSPQAAITLAERLKPIFDAVLQFFL